MKIGIYVGPAHPGNGGSYTLVRALVEALETCETKHALRILQLAPNDGPLPTSLPTTQISGARSPARRILNRVQDYLGMPDQRDAGVVAQIEALDLHLLWCLTPASLMTRLPYVATVWDLAHRLEPAFPEVSTTGWSWDSREAQYARVLPRATYVVVGGATLGEDVSRAYGVSPSRIRVLPLTCTPPRPPQVPQAASADRRPYLFYPAQFWPHKNHVGLLHALKEVREHHGLDLRLRLTGGDTGNLPHVRAVVEELGLSPHVSFEGFVSSERLAVLYSGALALVFPSFFGPDNLPPLEAMHLGCPVIAANVPGAADQLADAALLVNPRDAGEIATAIAQLAQDPALRATLIARGRDRAARWMPRDYVAGMLRVADEFESERRCWSMTVPYVHS